MSSEEVLKLARLPRLDTNAKVPESTRWVQAHKFCSRHVPWLCSG